MKTLVTGGAGFIGSNLVKLLLEKGFEVKVLDNLSTGYKRNLSGYDVEFIQGDIRDQQLLIEITKGVEAIFHLAASIGNVKSLNNPAEDSEVNVLGTVNVLEATRKNNVQKVIYSSSAAIFGELQDPPINENHPQNPDSPYGVSKLAGEKQCLCFAKIFDFQAVCLRYFNVYGINQRYDAYGNVIPIFANKLKSRQPLTIYDDGEQTRDFVNVRDVAMANYLAATQSAGTDVFNVGTGKSITINQLADHMRHQSRIDVSVVYQPPRKGEVRHCRADITKLHDKLGFVPSDDMARGLSEYLEWFFQDRREEK